MNVKKAGIALAYALFVAAFAVFLFSFAGLARANMMNVGVLMPGPPAPSDIATDAGITTETGDLLTTEAGVPVRIE